MGPNQRPQDWYFVPVVCKVDGVKVKTPVHKTFVKSYEEAVLHTINNLDCNWSVEVK